MFNVDKFDQSQLEHRTSELELPALKSYFDEGEKPAFKVRGLSGAELQVAIDAQKRNTTTESLIVALAKLPADVATIRQAIGLPSKDTPGELAKRIEMLTLGSVSPKLEQHIVVKLAEKFPIEFYQLTNLITELTGMGAEVMGKPVPASQPVETA